MRSAAPALLLLASLAAAAAAAPLLAERFDTLDAWSHSTDAKYTGKVKAVKNGDVGAMQVSRGGGGKGEGGGAFPALVFGGGGGGA